MDPKLSQFVTEYKGTPTNKVTWHMDRMVRWQIKNVLSPHLQGPWPAKLGRVLTQEEGASPKKSRDTLLCSQMENQKRYIFPIIGRSRCKKKPYARQK